MKYFARVSLIAIVASVLVTCGEARSGEDATPTYEYRVISLDRPTSTADAQEVAPLAPTKTATPALTVTATPLTTATSGPTRTPAPTAPPEVTERGEVIGGLWQAALLTPMDLPAGNQWTRQQLELPDSEDRTICGVSSPIEPDSAVQVDFEEPTGRYFVGEAIIEYVSPEIAQQMLLELQAYSEVLRFCEMIDEDSQPRLEVQQESELVPLELPAIGDDRIGYRQTISVDAPEIQETIQLDWVAIRVERLLVIVHVGDSDANLTDVNVALIERAIERVRIALTVPIKVPPAPIPELDVSTITTCDLAVQAILERMQWNLNFIAPMSWDEVFTDDELPEIRGTRADTTAIQNRAREIGCGYEEFNVPIVTGIERLEISGPLALYVSDLYRVLYSFN